MKVEFLAGEDITRAAKWLVTHAPAESNFNGVRIRARYATTNPADIVRHYWIRRGLSMAHIPVMSTIPAMDPIVRP